MKALTRSKSTSSAIKGFITSRGDPLPRAGAAVNDRDFDVASTSSQDRMPDVYQKAELPKVVADMKGNESRSASSTASSRRCLTGIRAGPTHGPEAVPVGALGSAGCERARLGRTSSRILQAFSSVLLVSRFSSASGRRIATGKALK